MLNARFLTLAGIVLSAAAMRLIPHPPNFTPMAAMALFGGAYFSSKKGAFAVPLSAMVLSDLILGFVTYDYGWFHATMPFIYGSFALTVCLGFWVRHRRTPLRIGLAALISAVLFFVISNFGVWLTGGLYPRTLEGLVTCYIAAIPFFRNTLGGNVAYTITLFGGYALLQHRFPELHERPAEAMAHSSVA